LSARESLRRLLENHCPGVELVGEAGNVAEAKELIKISDPDLLFLDIQLPDGDGFDLLRDLGNITFNIIFTTAYSEYAIKAFKYSTTHYLLKPIDPQDLTEAVAKAEEDLKSKNLQERFNRLLERVTGKNQRKIVLVTTNKIHVVNMSEIVMCEADKNYTTFNLESGAQITVARTLKEYEDILPKNFIKPHRQFMVNVEHLRSIEKDGGHYIKLSNNMMVPIASRKRDEILQKIREIYL
jgi:two-component system LytT family response regulator